MLVLHMPWNHWSPLMVGKVRICHVILGLHVCIMFDRMTMIIMMMMMTMTMTRCECLKTENSVCSGGFQGHWLWGNLLVPGPRPETVSPGCWRFEVRYGTTPTGSASGQESWLLILKVRRSSRISGRCTVALVWWGSKPKSLSGGVPPCSNQKELGH